MWLPIVVTFAGFIGFVLAGAALRSLSLASERTTRSCARWSIAFGILALGLAALWLSSVVMWPIEASNFQGPAAPTDLVRAPMMAMIASSALALVALPLALLALRIATRRSRRSQLRAALRHEDEQIAHEMPHRPD